MNFLDHYQNFAGVNESPKVYHTWCGISLLSHIIGRRVWTDEGMWKFYPNLYVALVGNPGIAKSTAMNVAKDFVKRYFPHIFVAPASITKESIIQTMSRDDQGCKIRYSYEGKTQEFAQLSIFANEYVSLLNAGGNPIGMIDFLTDVWDQDEYRDKTKNKGDHIIKNPYVSMLGCFTTDTAKALMVNKIITGGMSRRFVFVYADKNEKPVPRIVYRDDQLESYSELQRMAKEIEKKVGGFRWSEDGDRFYQNWYEDNFYRQDKERSPSLRFFLRSKPGICTKVSMLLALGEEKPELVHTEDTFRRAVSLVSEIEQGAAILFDGEGRNELTSVAKDIAEFIKSEKIVTEKSLKIHFWKEFKNGDPAELERILTYLQNSGQITQTLSNGGMAIRWNEQKE